MTYGHFFDKVYQYRYSAQRRYIKFLLIYLLSLTKQPEKRLIFLSQKYLNYMLVKC